MIRTEKRALGIYIHIPFCARKCHYCDFVSFSGSSREEQSRYFSALSAEIRGYRGDEDNSDEIGVGDYQVDTVFFGGGTPSLPDPERIAGALDALREIFQIEENAEITLEANPGTLDAGKLRAYKEMGVNRLSLGVQSLDDDVLRDLGRIHDRRTVLRNIEQARRAGFSNLNLDLMFGIPGQSAESWDGTLREALDLEPEHLSFYSLQIEEGTDFFEWFASGKLEQPSQELDRRMYHEALALLADRGYIHYEISNAAKEGFACRHNLKYWSMEDYLGLGLSAHSYLRGVRFFNPSDMEQYLKGGGPEEVHKNDRNDSISDYLFTQLRKIQGISMEDFERRFGVELTELLGPEIRRFTGEGLLRMEGGRLRFTEKGLDFTNTVLRELLTAGGDHE